MHEHLTILGIALVILGYGYFSRLINRFNISGPMVFTAVGILLSPLFLGDHPVHPDAEAIQIVAEIALIVILFSDAAAIDLSHLKTQWRLPARLLFVSMPLSILLSYGTAKLFFPDQPDLYLLLLALILAPTDAALGKAVVSDKSIPETIRNTINVESGLNDGIAFPVLLTILALIAGGSGEAHGGGNGPLAYIARQIVVGALAGALVGWIGARLGNRAIRKDWMEHQYRNLIPIALAIFAYCFAEHFGGNGYIAAFFGGLVLGNTSDALRESTENFAESEGEFLVMVSFLVFGLVFVPATIGYWDLTAWIYALLSLTLLRMLPVALGFGFFSLDLSTRLFIGWFGPRGIASILYILVAAGQLGGIEGHETVYAVASLTILLSIVLHGLSAKPLAKIYSRRQRRKTPTHKA
jgi:NhaP-type Na+/H+ or K+/H+ antiporter